MATSEFGMSFDRSDAGREWISNAYGILLSGHEDDDIQ